MLYSTQSIMQQSYSKSALTWGFSSSFEFRVENLSLEMRNFKFELSNQEIGYEIIANSKLELEVPTSSYELENTTRSELAQQTFTQNYSITPKLHARQTDVNIGLYNKPKALKAVWYGLAYRTITRPCISNSKLELAIGISSSSWQYSHISWFDSSKLELKVATLTRVFNSELED
jgi:hypothetical protein